MQKVTIGTVLFDQAKGAAVVTLAEETGDRVLPIFIGMWEGMAIYRELNRAPAHRPMLHDLFLTVFQGLDARLERVEIDALSETTYFARLYLRQKDTVVIADARPSDALALAVKCQAPIYVAEEVLDAAAKRGDFTATEDETTSGEVSASPEDVKAWLENIRPEDFADPH